MLSRRWVKDCGTSRCRLYMLLSRTCMLIAATSYGSEVMAAIFRSAGGTQFLLCEYGKTLWPQTREWYVKPEKKKKLLAESYAGRHFKECRFVIFASRLCPAVNRDQAGFQKLVSAIAAKKWNWKCPAADKNRDPQMQKNRNARGV